MKLVSWNVNGLRAVERKGDLFSFIKNVSPDLLFLQEIKGNKEQFSDALTCPEDYETFYHSAKKKGYSGTGIWVKKKILDQSSDHQFFSGMPVENKEWEDEEGRIVGIKMKLAQTNYTFIGVYFPNGGKSEEAFQGKLVFYNDFLNFINRLRASGETCIWTGDVNCAHQEIDLARPEENEGKVGFHPRERAWLDQVINHQWTDIWRKKNPNLKEVYSWWHYYTQSRKRNIGWRIDYFFCEDDFYPRVKEISYLNHQMGSDHCPVSLEIKIKE